MRMPAKPHGTEIKEEHKKFEKKKRTRNDNNTTACAHIPPYALLVPRRLTGTTEDLVAGITRTPKMHISFVERSG